MSHTFDYNIYVDGEVVDGGQLTIHVEDRMKAYYDAYAIVSERAQPEGEVEIIVPEWYSAETALQIGDSFRTHIASYGFFEDLSKEKQIEVLEEIIEHDSKNPRYSWSSGEIYDPSSQYDDKTVPSVAFLLDGKNVNPKVMLEHLKKSANAESFAAPTGYTERGPRPFYGNPRKMALDRWGNRRFIRRRKDGTYMKNVDVGRSLAMDRRRQSQTWAPAGYRDQGDGSPSLLARLLDMFRGVDEEILMAESYLMCADCDTYSSECGCHNSESDAYIFAYNDGHSDARRDGSYRPSTTDREITSFKKIFKQ